MTMLAELYMIILIRLDRTTGNLLPLATIVPSAAVRSPSRCHLNCCALFFLYDAVLIINRFVSYALQLYKIDFGSKGRKVVGCSYVVVWWLC
jgi:hypothetical protein